MKIMKMALKVNDVKVAEENHEGKWKQSVILNVKNWEESSHGGKMKEK